jgi:hypothetical protein
MSNLELAVKEIPQLINLLKAKFSSAPEFKEMIFGGDKVFYEGELSLGTNVFIDFNKEMDECVNKNKEQGKSAEEAKEVCKAKGKYERIPAPAKTYEHTDGTKITVEGGKVVDIKKPEEMKTDLKAFAEELFKAFPKTDLSAIEAALAELKSTLAAISLEKNELKSKVEKFETFKTDVMTILEKFSKTPSTPSTVPAKTTSSKSIFNTELTFEERVKILNSQS